MSHRTQATFETARDKINELARVGEAKNRWENSGQIAIAHALIASAKILSQAIEEKRS